MSYFFREYPLRFELSSLSSLKKTIQPTFTCSKSTIKTIKKGVKYVQS